MQLIDKAAELTSKALRGRSTGQLAWRTAVTHAVGGVAGSEGAHQPRGQHQLQETETAEDDTARFRARRGGVFVEPWGTSSWRVLGLGHDKVNKDHE